MKTLGNLSTTNRCAEVFMCVGVCSGSHVSNLEGSSRTRGPPYQGAGVGELPGPHNHEKRDERAQESRVILLQVSDWRKVRR